MHDNSKGWRKGERLIYFLQISDTHHLENHRQNQDNFREALVKMEYLQRKLEVLAQIIDKPLDFICHCGDLTHNGGVSDYEAVKDYFNQYFPQVPLLTTVGNHDNFSAMETVFSRETHPLSGAVHFFSDLQVISLNSCNGGSGELTEEQGQWLQEQLEKHPEKNSILFTHHHFLQAQSPMPRGEIAKGFQQVLEQSKISVILGGHTHYFFQGTLCDVPFYAVDSFSFKGSDSGQGYLKMKEASGYNLFSIEDGRVVLEQRGNLRFQKELGISFF